MPKRYLTEEIVAEAMARYPWPAAYAIDDDLPDGIIVAFPACAIYFSEGFEGDVELEFLPESTGTEAPVTLADALLALIPEHARGSGPLTPGLSTDYEPSASLQKVRTGVDDICRILQAHFLPSISGDLSWAARLSGT